MNSMGQDFEIRADFVREVIEAQAGNKTIGKQRDGCVAWTSRNWQCIDCPRDWKIA